METINPKDLEAIALKHDYKHAGLYDAAGRCIAGMNNHKTPLQSKINQIRKRLDAQPDGFYTIRFQHTLGKIYPVFDYITQVGEAKGPAQVITPQIVAPLSQNAEPVRGWEEALKDKQSLATLEAENKRLQDELARHKSALAEIEEEEEEEESEEEETQAPQMMEKAKTFLSETIPQLLPVIDKHYELRARALDLKEKELELEKLKLQNGAARKAGPNLRSVHPWRPVPSPEDTDRWAQYIAWLNNVSDTIFTAEITYIELNRPDIWPHIAAIFPADNGGQNEANA